MLLCYSPKKRNLKRSFQLENFKIRAVEGAHLPLIELYTPDVSSHIIVAANAKQQQVRRAANFMLRGADRFVAMDQGAHELQDL